MVRETQVVTRKPGGGVKLKTGSSSSITSTNVKIITVNILLVAFTVFTSVSFSVFMFLLWKGLI